MFKSIKINILLVPLLLFFSCQSQNKNSQTTEPTARALKLINIQQLQVSNIFDLSGITRLKSKDQDTFLVASDNESTVYALDTSSYSIRPYLSIERKGDLDIEALDHCGSTVFAVFETGTNQIFKLSEGKPEKIDFKYEKKFESKNWGNKGIEGFALNCQENVLFFVKERSPAYLFRVNLQDSKPRAETIFTKELFSNPKNDATDLKFVAHQDRNYLYILKRFECAVDRIDFETGQITHRSFAQYVNNTLGEQVLYNVPAENRFFGLAEALLITENEIWIGLDNNGRSINAEHNLSIKYDLKGTAPVILRFERGGF